MDIFSLIGDLFMMFVYMVVAGLIVCFGLARGAAKCAKVLHCCLDVPDSKSAYRGRAAIVDEMALKHADPKDWKSATDSAKLEHHMVYDIYHWNATDGVEAFIRLCHMVGIEIVIRPVNKDLQDIDKNPEETRKRLRVLRKNYYREIGRRR